MSDFHRSLDRALEPEPHIRWSQTQHFPAGQDIRALQERINESVRQALVVSNSFAVRRDPAYDDGYLRDASILDWYDRIDCKGTE